MNDKDICDVIADALNLKPGSVKITDGAETIKEWDSLGFLSILGALEKTFGGKVAAIDDLANVKSVKEIVDLFNREKII